MNFRTFMSDTKITDVTELFKGYTKMIIRETYGTFWLIEKGSEIQPILQKGQHYDLNNVIKIGYHMSEGQKSLPTFHYTLS